MKITKYDHLTTEELLAEAYESLTDNDELALALMARLMDVSDELESLKEDYENDMGHADQKIAALRAELVEGVPV